VIEEAGDRVLGDAVGDFLGTLRTVRPEPVRCPVESTEKCAARDRRIRGAQPPAANPVGDERADAALVAVAFGHDPRPQTRRQGVHLEVCRRAVDLVEQAQHVRRGEVAQPHGERRAGTARPRQRGEHPIERLVLTEEQQFVLAAEVVIQIPGRKVRGGGNVAHPGGGEPAGAEHLGGGAHDRDAPRVGAFRTTVRKVNHCSILVRFSRRSTRPGCAERPLLRLHGIADAAREGIREP